MTRIPQQRRRYCLKVRAAEAPPCLPLGSPPAALTPLSPGTAAADSPVTGKLRFEGTEYQLTVLHLPCVTESYQTYDDVNLVKTTDVGQVLVVGAITEEEAQTGEARNGITPPMRNARQRLFRKPIDVGSRVVHRVEQQLLTVIQGGAPDGYKFVDHEEIWQINESTGRGEWVPVKRQ